MPDVKGPGRSSGAGFSIIEILAVLAIGSAVLVSVSSLGWLILGQDQRSAARAETFDRLEQGLALLVREIGRMDRARWDGPVPRPFVFQGSEDSIVFATRGPGADRIAILSSVARDASADLLWREGVFSSGAHGIDAVDFGESRPVYSGPLRFRFAYIAPRTATMPEVMTDAWLDRSRMPVAIRVSLVDPRTGEARFHARMPLLTTAEPGCLTPRRAACTRLDLRLDADDDEPPRNAAPTLLPQAERRP